MFRFFKIILVFTYFLSFNACTPKNKKPSSKPTYGVIEVRQKELNGKSYIDSINVLKVDSSELKIKSLQMSLVDFSGNEYPEFTVDVSEKTQFVSYSLCQISEKNEYCIKDYTSSNKFVIHGLNRINYKSELPLNFIIRACVDPVHTIGKESCGVEYKEIREKPLFFGKISNPAFDVILGEIEEKKLEIKNNGKKFSQLIDEYLKKNPKASETQDGNQSVLSMLKNIGSYQIGEEFLNSKEKFVNSELYLADLSAENGKASMPINPLNKSQIQPPSCFTTEDWNKLNETDQCKLIQGIFKNPNDLYDCGMGKWNNKNANHPKWFFSADRICSTVNNCNVFPDKDECKSYRSNYGKGSCTCEPTTYYLDSITDIGNKFNSRKDYSDALNSWDKCVSKSQVAYLLQRKKTCMLPDDFQKALSREELGDNLLTGGVIVFAVGGAVAFAGMHKNINEPAVVVIGAVIAAVGLAVLGGGYYVSMDAQDQRMNLIDQKSYRQEFDNLFTKNTTDVISLRKAEFKKYSP